MDNALLWVGILGGIVLPILGWLNSRINDLEKLNDNTKSLAFKKLEEERAYTESCYVRRDLYEQNIKHNSENIKSAMDGFTQYFNSQFQSMKTELTGINSKLEEKSKDIKDLEAKIEGLRELIIKNK